MPTYIHHRTNSISDLAKVPVEDGVEIDLRSAVDQAGEMHLSHDAWKRGDSFEAWLRYFKKLNIAGPIILNTKEDGLETRAMEMLSSFDISNFLFLDTTLPTLVKSVQNGMGKHFMLRLSSYEPVELAYRFVGDIDWIWLDCFGGVPMSPSIIKPLTKNFKICLVSPELHGFSADVKSKFTTLGMLSSAICTKNVLDWKDILANS